MGKNQFQLNRMRFTLICDREIPDREHNHYYISPGGYELSNGKRFDFKDSIGEADQKDRTKVYFEVSGLDADYSDELTEEDLKLPFTEFYIFTGDAEDEEMIGIREVQDVSFEVEKNGKISSVSATKEQMDSINASTKAEYERFLVANKNEPELD